MKRNLSLRDFPSSKLRRGFLEKQLNISLDNISDFAFTEDAVTGRNIENLIGATEIPLGIAGPLVVRGAKGKVQSYYIPLATTEGALVASISRGAKTVTEAGGATVFVEDVGVSRGPVFKTKGIEHAMATKKWVEKNFSLLSRIGQKTSSHLKVLKFETAISGKNLFIRFSFNTGDAMGMNMATIATEAMVREIEKKTKVKCIALAGNFDVDKKPSWLNFILGRGKKIWAEVLLPKAIVKEVLKVTPEQIVEVVKIKAHLGSMLSGSMGFNSHFANIIAAIFAATGQDLAHISEGGLGITDAEVAENGNLYFSIYLPSIQIGTVGGGTHLPTQQEALKILGVKKVVELAEVLGAAVLAGELSLIASLAEGTLASAHRKLARKGGQKRVKSQV